MEQDQSTLLQQCKSLEKDTDNRRPLAEDSRCKGDKLGRAVEQHRSELHAHVSELEESKRRKSQVAEEMLLLNSRHWEETTSELV